MLETPKGSRIVPSISYHPRTVLAQTDILEKYQFWRSCPVEEMNNVFGHLGS